MPHLYALTGILPGDPIHLYVYVDDGALITSLEQPPYRSADVAIKALVLGWDEYIPQDDEGSPLPKNIEQFMEYISAAYGAQTYMTRLLW